MAIPILNPYKEGVSLFTDGLDYIIANIPGSPTYSDLSDTIIDYFNSLPDPPTDGITLIETGMANSVNDYVNSKIAQNQNFGGAEWAMVDAVLCGIKEQSIDSTGDFLDACMEQLTQSDINTISKTSIYAAIGLAKASDAYWKAIVTTPGGWATYINSNAAINYANIPFWTTATFAGTFSGFAQVQAPNMGEANVWNTDGRKFASVIALGSALVLTAGKVIFKWAQRPVVGNFPSVDSMLKGGGGCGCNNF